MAVTSQSNTILIINVYRCQIQFELLGHQGRIEAIEWANHDQLLYSACKGGLIMQWNTYTGVKLNEYKEKNYIWHSLTVRLDGGLVFASGKKQDTDTTTELCAIEFFSTPNSSPVKNLVILGA